MKATYSINGMTCAACASKIERKLNKMEGVHEAVVNLVTEKASVDFDEQKIDFDTMQKNVADLDMNFTKTPLLQSLTIQTFKTIKLAG